MTISRVFMICDAYESGMGKGLKRKPRMRNIFGNPEHEEAYQIGYELGFERSLESKSKTPKKIKS